MPETMVLQDPYVYLCGLLDPKVGPYEARTYHMGFYRRGILIWIAVKEFSLPCGFWIMVA